MMQEVAPNVGNLSSKWVPLKEDLISIKRIFGLVHKFSRSMNFFYQKRFVWVLTAFKGFWYTYICFDPNYRKVVVASIQILLAQRILDMAYFLKCYYYGHLLNHCDTQSRRNLLLCATSERVPKQQHWIEMLALPRQNTIMPLSGLLHRVRWYYDFCLNIGCLAI